MSACATCIITWPHPNAMMFVRKRPTPGYAQGFKPMPDAYKQVTFPGDVLPPR